MLALIRFSGIDYTVDLSFREFADATSAPDFYGEPAKFVRELDVYFRPVLIPEYMEDSETSYIAYERMLASLKKIRTKLVNAYDLNEDDAAKLYPWNVEKVVPID